MIASNLPDLFIKQANKQANRIAFEYRKRRKEPYRSISWRNLLTRVQEVAYGLIELGVKKGDNVAILCGTRYEWAVSDLAIMSCGGVVVPIYPTLPETSVNYILNNANCEIVILEDKGQLQKIRSQWDKLPNIRYVIVVEDLGDLPQNDPRILNFRNVRDKGRLNFSFDPQLVEKHINDIELTDPATIIYTSGTTGPPKGVVLTHENILSVLSGLPEILPIYSDDKFLSFLPLSHVFERIAGLYYVISAGGCVVYCSSIDQIALMLKDSGVTAMLVVPRILEKLSAKINHQLDSLPPLRKKLFFLGLEMGKSYLSLKTSKNFFSLNFIWSCFCFYIARTFIFLQLRKKIAPALKFFISGGAPLPYEIAEFFYIIGIPVLEGYGLTETSAPATVNTRRKFKLGTVGIKLPNIQIKIAKDGEILIKGPTVFKEYYKNEADSKTAFFEDWFCTGDVGEIDSDGFLKITGRKKDIIVNSAGKNISPQNIENSIRMSPYISHFVVIGDKRKYLSALVTLDSHAVLNYIKQNSFEIDGDISELSNNPKIVKLIDEEIKLRTAAFADFEQIRRFIILPNDFSINSGEITPTLKVKRKFVEEKYKSLIDGMYPAD